MSMILVQVVVGGLLLGAVYALFSSGLTLIWGMMNVVNFAHGDFVMLGMYTAVKKKKKRKKRRNKEEEKKKKYKEGNR